MARHATECDALGWFATYLECRRPEVGRDDLDHDGGGAGGRLESEVMLMLLDR